MVGTSAEMPKHYLKRFEENLLNCLGIIASLSVSAYSNDIAYFELDLNNDFNYNQDPITGTPYATLLTSSTLIWIVHRLLVKELFNLTGKKIIRKDFIGKIEFDFINKVRYMYI